MGQITREESRAIRQGTLGSLVDLLGGVTTLKPFGPRKTTVGLRALAMEMRFSFKDVSRGLQPETMRQRGERIVRALTNSLYGLEPFFQAPGVVSIQ